MISSLRSPAGQSGRRTQPRRSCPSPGLDCRGHRSEHVRRSPPRHVRPVRVVAHVCSPRPIATGAGAHHLDDRRTAAAGRSGSRSSAPRRSTSMIIGVLRDVDDARAEDLAELRDLGAVLAASARTLISASSRATACARVTSLDLDHVDQLVEVASRACSTSVAASPSTTSVMRESRRAACAPTVRLSMLKPRRREQVDDAVQDAGLVLDQGARACVGSWLALAVPSVDGSSGVRSPLGPSGGGSCRRAARPRAPSG